MVKDIVGKKLEVGDTVAFNQPNYRCMILGTIVKINPKTLRISYRDNRSEEETSEYPFNVCKVIKQGD